MTLKSLLSLKARFSANGAATENGKASHEDTPFYSGSERASIKLLRMEAQTKARTAVKAAGVMLDPRIAKALSGDN